MEYALNYWVWFIAGALLILLEFFVPGLVVIFLGLGAWATAALLYLRLVSDLFGAIAAFVLASLLFLSTLRRLVLRFYPSSSERVETDEDVLLIGKAATAVTHINPENFAGRVNYSGTTWPAKSERGMIATGARVVITARENINLIVREADE